jgi:hypothetical protein
MILKTVLDEIRFIQNIFRDSVKIEGIKSPKRFSRHATWRFTLDPPLKNLYNKQESLSSKYDEIIHDINRMEFIIGREQDEVKSLKESAKKIWNFYYPIIVG